MGYVKRICVLGFSNIATFQITDTAITAPVIIIIIIISFMQGIYTYIPEKNCVPREYSVAAILLLLFMVLISLVSVLNLLYFYVSTFRSVCAVPNMAVFYISFTSCFPGMLLTYFLNEFEIVPLAPIITGITFVFTFHMRCISIVRSLYFIIIIIIIIITILSLVTGLFSPVLHMNQQRSPTPNPQPPTLKYQTAIISVL